MLRARSRRRDRVRTLRTSFAAAAAAAAVLVVALRFRPTAEPADVEFSTAPARTESKASAPPVVSEEPDGGSILPEISGDGRSVAFMSDAANLVPGDAN